MKSDCVLASIACTSVFTQETPVPWQSEPTWLSPNLFSLWDAIVRAFAIPAVSVTLQMWDRCEGSPHSLTIHARSQENQGSNTASNLPVSAGIWEQDPSFQKDVLLHQSKGMLCSIIPEGCSAPSALWDVLLHQFHGMSCSIIPEGCLAPSALGDVLLHHSRGMSCFSQCDHEQQLRILATLWPLWPTPPREMLQLPRGQGLCLTRGCAAPWGDRISCSPQVMLWVSNYNTCTQVEQPKWCPGQSSLLISTWGVNDRLWGIVIFKDWFEWFSFVFHSMDRSPNPPEIPISLNKEFQVFWKTLRIYCCEMINILEVILN